MKLQKKPKVAPKKGPTPTKLPENARIPQAEAKMYMPDGGFVWQARRDRAWKSRAPPFTEVSRSWARHGEEHALFLVVKNAWEKWCTINGVAPDECPMVGVFVRSAGSSSASGAPAASG